MSTTILGTSSSVYMTVAAPTQPAARIPMPAGPLIRGSTPPDPAVGAAPATTTGEAPVNEVVTPTGETPPTNLYPAAFPPVYREFPGKPPSSAEGSSPADARAATEGDSGPSESTPSEGNESPPVNDPPGNLSPEEYRQVQELKVRDRQVRQHEQAHLAAGGRYVTGGVTYSYVTGPDGRQYAVGGEVSIDTSKEATPEQTLIKAQVIRRAALATAEPSAQDRSVAALATQMEAEARREILENRRQELRESQDAPPVGVRGIPEGFEFTEIGPGKKSQEEGRNGEGGRPPIGYVPVPLPPEARTDVGRLIDYRG